MAVIKSAHGKSMANKVVPTTRHREAAKLIFKGASVSSAMRQVGYKAATAKNPKNLTESKGWQQLLDEYISDEELVAIHKVGLRNSDPNVRFRYMDSAYKLKGSYAPEKHATLNVNVDVEQNQEALEFAAKLYGEAVMQKKLDE